MKKDLGYKMHDGGDRGVMVPDIRLTIITVRTIVTKGSCSNPDCKIERDTREG